MCGILNFTVSFPGLGINDLSISRVAFQFNLFGRQVTVFWYGLLFAIAMVLCIALAMRHAKYHNFDSNDILDFFLWMIPFILIGARIYYVIFEWDQFRGNWKSAFNIRQGGLAFYGGVIGGIVAILVVAKFKKIKFYRPLDFLVVYVPLGQAIGRWGNFFNQEAFGTNTSKTRTVQRDPTCLSQSRQRGGRQIRGDATGLTNRHVLPRGSPHDSQSPKQDHKESTSS
jgi:phosphatidylglycerol:prolipoprotein diacylglycerol transferase